MNHFISCDWGTSKFRLRVVEVRTGKILESYQDDSGIKQTHLEWQKWAQKVDCKAFYLNLLSEKVANLKSVLPEECPVLISGMASSSIGYHELPYAQTPFDLRNPDLIFEPDSLPGTSRIVWLFSGLQTEKDVMRGEETLVLGAYALEATDKTLILPGTHSKHVNIENGKVTGFKTFMTGEFFDLLSSQSVLQNTVRFSSDINSRSFENGVLNGVKGNLLNAAFQARTGSVLEGKPATENYEYLSGLLIGSELKELVGSEKKIEFISSTGLEKAYASAASILLKPKQFSFTSADDALIAGHDMLFHKFCRR